MTASTKEALEGLVEAVRRDADEGGKGISGYTSARLSDARAALAAPPSDVMEGINVRQEAANLTGILDYMEHTKAWQFDPSHVAMLIKLVRDRLASGLVTAAHPDEAAIRADEREKMRANLACLIVENDSEDADDECELCGGRGTVDAYTERSNGCGALEGRDEIGCPACIERQHSRVIAAAIRARRGE